VTVNACGPAALSRNRLAVDDNALSSALDRAERALRRVESALANHQPTSGRDEELRAKVREVVEELDELIKQAAA
jgi:hypothetical protein